MRSKIASNRPTSFLFSLFPSEIIEIRTVTALTLSEKVDEMVMVSLIGSNIVQYWGTIYIHSRIIFGMKLQQLLRLLRFIACYIHNNLVVDPKIIFSLGISFYNGFDSSFGPWKVKFIQKDVSQNAVKM